MILLNPDYLASLYDDGFPISLGMTPTNILDNTNQVVESLSRNLGAIYEGRDLTTFISSEI
jgi:hypothetical protein